MVKSEGNGVLKSLSRRPTRTRMSFGASVMNKLVVSSSQFKTDRTTITKRSPPRLPPITHPPLKAYLTQGIDDIIKNVFGFRSEILSQRLQPA